MSIVRRKMMGIKLGSRGGAVTYTNKQEIVCTKSPDVDTALDVFAYLRTQGFYDGAPLLIDPRYTCTDLDVDTSKASQKVGANGGNGLWYWPVVSVFSSQPAKDPQNNKQEDPTKRLPEIAIRLAEHTLPATYDANGDQIANSAGDPLRMDDQRARVVITIDRILRSVDPDIMQDCRPRKSSTGSTGSTGPANAYLYSRNQASWNPFGTYGPIFNGYQVDGGKGLLRVLTCSLHFENASPFASFHAEIHVDEDFHRDRPWDVGFRGWLDEDDEELGFKKVQLLDPVSGMFPAAPLPLNGAGVQLDISAPTQKLFALVFQRFPEKDWAKVPGLVMP